MSIQEKDSLDCLFSRRDMKLVNIKFARGNAEIISPAQLTAEVCSIRRQLDDGLQPAAGPVRAERQPANIRKLIETL